jgi:hypothetical protein
MILTKKEVPVKPGVDLKKHRRNLTAKANKAKKEREKAMPMHLNSSGLPSRLNFRIVKKKASEARRKPPSFFPLRAFFAFAVKFRIVWMGQSAGQEGNLLV